MEKVIRGHWIRISLDRNHFKWFGFDLERGEGLPGALKQDSPSLLTLLFPNKMYRRGYSLRIILFGRNILCWSSPWYAPF